MGGFLLIRSGIGQGGAPSCAVEPVLRKQINEELQYTAEEAGYEIHERV